MQPATLAHARTTSKGPSNRFAADAQGLVFAHEHGSMTTLAPNPLEHPERWASLASNMGSSPPLHTFNAVADPSTDEVVGPNTTNAPSAVGRHSGGVVTLQPLAWLTSVHPLMRPIQPLPRSVTLDGAGQGTIGTVSVRESAAGPDPKMLPKRNGRPCRRRRILCAAATTAAGAAVSSKSAHVHCWKVDTVR